MVNTEVNTDFQSNVGLPTFRFRLKKFDKIQNSAHFDHWNIPLRLLFFIQQTECYDGLFHLQYCMIPEDCHIVLFDSEQNAAPVVLDYGQNGKDKPYVQTPLEVFEKSERLSVVKDCQPHNIIAFIKKLSDICPPDILFVFLNIAPDEDTLDAVMGKRTLLLKNSMTDILEVMASTMRESDQKRLHKLVHECCISLASVPESDKSIYSRHFASQIALQKCNFPLGLVFSYLTRIRILSLSEKCPMSNDVKIDPYGYRLISLMHELNAEFLEKAVYMVTNAHRMRIPSLPPLPKDIKESEIPNLPEGDIIETKYSFELKTYPKVIMADTNFISEFQIYCSTRHVALPSYSDQSISIQGENPTFSVSLTTHNRTFQSPTAFCDKKTAKSEVTKLAMVELGLLRLSPKALKVMKYLKKGERVQLLKSPEAVNDLFKANTEKSANELNPVSLLGEFCSKRNLSLPEYTAVSEEYGISAITFRVTVTVNSHSATSDSHASKRLAKRDCSEKLLKILDPIYPETSTSENSTISSSVTPMDVETSTFSKQLNSNNSFDEISNYTTALYELCQGKSMDLPSYTFEDIAGVPLQFKASCSIPALKLEIKNPNAYSSKKTAKHEVSKLVFIECKKLLNSN